MTQKSAPASGMPWLSVATGAVLGSLVAGGLVAAGASWSWWTFHAQEMAVIAAIREHELRAHRGETAELQAGARASSRLADDRVAPTSPPAGLTDAKKREFEALAAELRTLRQQAAQAEATQQAAADDGESSDTPAVLINSLGMQLKLVPAGTFRMGQNPSAVVTISEPFYLGVYEVSQAECAALLGERKHPGASGTEADTFCLRLSRLPEELAAGRVYRLPTEAEWEYACRAGTETAYAFGDDPALLGDFAWFADNAPGHALPSGLKQPNAWGFYDMHGNLWEWCSDLYGSPVSTDVTDPQGLTSGTLRVIRGGSWFSQAANCESAHRHGIAPVYSTPSMGFRVALSMPDQDSSEEQP